MTNNNTTVRGETDLADLLIAARALIDTPEKWAAFGKSWTRAIYHVTADWDSYTEAEQAVSACRVRGLGHASILSRFDRAIASQEQKNG